MVLNDTPNTLLQFPELHGTCLQQQLQAFSHPIYINSRKRVCTNMLSMRYSTKIVPVNDITTTAKCELKEGKSKRFLVLTLLTSVKSLNKSILVAHAS